MQYALLIILAVLTAHACRRIRFWRLMGFPLAVRRRYLAASWGMGLTIWGAMLTQEAILLSAGLLTWQTGLPLHLCSLMGVLTLPMLLTRHPVLVNTAFYAGIPGAMLALVFPAVLQTPWPRLTTLAFHTLHASLILAPLLPMSLGWRPRPMGAVLALGFLALTACVVSGVNAITGGNYLFLAGPVAGTPLQWLARWGLGWYRMLLGLLAMLVIAGEAALVRRLRHAVRGR
ncbi:MAG: YwaF family protein [Clostridia bacterium]|nr:YwaF family protein [Clostridia bacterium]